MQPAKLNLIELLQETFRNHAVLAITGMALITFGIFSTIAILFPFNREIFYEMHPVFSMCLPSSAGENTQACVARMELNVGNTGDTEESVALRWPDITANWSTGHNVFNISADRRRSHDPVIHCEMTDGRQECTIEQFAAGTLVVMHMDCLRCNSQEISRLHETPLEIQSEAHTFYGDPRVTLLLRRLMALAQLF